MNKALLNLLGWALILGLGLHYCGRKDTEPQRTYTKPPSVVVSNSFQDENSPFAKYGLKNLLNIWDDFINFNKPDITSLPDCPDTLEPLERFNCRHDLVNQLAAIEKQTFDRALYLINDKPAFKLNQEKWISDTLNKCKADKQDACLETAYTEHIRALFASTFRLVDIIQTGVFSARPFIGSYNFNWPIIVLLGFLSVALFFVILALFFYARTLEEKLQAALNNPGPASGTSNQNSSTPPPNAPKPWHEVLNVAPDAPHAEVKKAWQILMKIYHPDKSAHLGDDVKEEAKKMCSDINAAYTEAKTVNGWA